MNSTLNAQHAHEGESSQEISHPFVRDYEGKRAASADPSCDGDTVTLYATETIGDHTGSIVSFLSAEAAEQLAAQLLCSARLARQSRS